MAVFEFTGEEAYSFPAGTERMEELACLFFHGLMEDDPDSAMEYFLDTCGMAPEEIQYFLGR